MPALGQWLGVITLERGHKCFYSGIRGELCAGGRSAAWRGAWRVRARRPSPSAYNKRARRTRRLASATTAAPVHDARSALCDLLAPRTSYRGKRSRRHRPRRKRDTILLYSVNKNRTLSGAHHIGSTLQSKSLFYIYFTLNRSIKYCSLTIC